MCGIVAAVSSRNVVPYLIQGLERLEYRGYDSCGIAIHTGTDLKRARSTERVVELKKNLTQADPCTTVFSVERQGARSAETGVDSKVHEDFEHRATQDFSRKGGCAGVSQENWQAATGIAHTRWATHGSPLTHNAHPHFSFGTSNSTHNARIALVHNGIIENFEALRAKLSAQGYTFESQTDTEVIAHLIDSLYDGHLWLAVRAATARLKGAYALAVIAKDEPSCVVGARSGSPLVVGLGEDGERLLASDALALAGICSQMMYLDEGDVVELKLGSCQIADRTNQTVERTIKPMGVYGNAAELGGYQHYMQKEIFEQPVAIANTLEGLIEIVPDVFGATAAQTFEQIDRILILACGTSYYSGCIAKYWLEQFTKLPTQVEVASEYRYRETVPHPNTLVIVISQSGETADTLMALRHAQSLGMHHTLAICNVATSAMVRECSLAYITRAGVEVGVASTKAFTTQLAALFLLTLCLARQHGHLSEAEQAKHLNAMRHLPIALQAVLALEPQIITWAEQFARVEHALFLGRGVHYPIALEGALKLKEISYIHAEAYPAGELKHGPLALVTNAMPVVTVAPNDALLEKLKSNMQEVRARGGMLYVLADADTHIQSDIGLSVIRLPEHYGALSPLLHVVPLQLLAYHTACLRGSDVDKPRNLAKSVTVE